MDHDWVFRQLHLYEFGGLKHFPDGASADLVSGADRIQQWATAPMGGFRLLGSQPATVTWEDLAGGDPVVTPNIGSACLVEPGECVIGRLVPIEGGAMFESTPLVVPEVIADRVAEFPELDRRCDRRRKVRRIPRSPHPGTPPAASDVPMSVWMYAVCESGGFADRLGPASAQLAEASLNLARAALERSEPPDEEELDPWSCVSAAVLSPRQRRWPKRSVRPTVPFSTGSGDPRRTGSGLRTLPPG